MECIYSCNFNLITEEQSIRGGGMATAFARGAQAMHTMFLKPVGRKFHKKSSSADMVRETRKFEGDQEMKNTSHNMEMGMGSENEANIIISWVPHQRTGIYYPKGQEKVMDEMSSATSKDMGVNWFS